MIKLSSIFSNVLQSKLTTTYDAETDTVTPTPPPAPPDPPVPQSDIVNGFFKFRPDTPGWNTFKSAESTKALSFMIGDKVHVYSVPRNSVGILSLVNAPPKHPRSLAHISSSIFTSIDRNIYNILDYTTILTTVPSGHTILDMSASSTHVYILTFSPESPSASSTQPNYFIFRFNPTSSPITLQLRNAFRLPRFESADVGNPAVDSSYAINPAIWSKVSGFEFIDPSNYSSIFYDESHFLSTDLGSIVTTHADNSYGNYRSASALLYYLPTDFLAGSAICPDDVISMASHKHSYTNTEIPANYAQASFYSGTPTQYRYSFVALDSQYRLWYFGYDSVPIAADNNIWNNDVQPFNHYLGYFYGSHKPTGVIFS